MKPTTCLNCGWLVRIHNENLKPSYDCAYQKCDLCGLCACAFRQKEANK